MKKIIPHYFGLLIILIISSCQSDTTNDKQSKTVIDAYQLVWSDEFETNGLPDSTKWSYDYGIGCPNCGWGNNELQFYTKNKLENARVEDGKLIIEAHKEIFEKSQYTSARLVTKEKGDWLYGKFEIRAKLPDGRGTWPAIWMLSTDWEYGGWPESGEIDIMEHVGYAQDTVHGTIHTKSYNHIIGTQKAGTIEVNVSEEFHTYGLEWTEKSMIWSIDGKPYFEFKNENKTFNEWPFDKRFHLILNLAVGGNWGGKYGVDESVFPKQMIVDYVRVYQKMTKKETK
ncbi:MAG: glycoside hydrolase family 16 protein [Saprospiraceae bacterium]|nr:glycoside hydrolase family 16 protein [Saprospiraceae bacterium]